MKNTKTKSTKKIEYEEQEAEKWIKKHGAAGFDFAKRDIILWDGGLFAIEKYTEMLSRIRGKKPLPDGGCEILFTKKKYPQTCYKAMLWFEELDDTITYLQSMKRFLNKMGYATSYPRPKETPSKLSKTKKAKPKR
jgi:hypothetical protein